MTSDALHVEGSCVLQTIGPVLLACFTPTNEEVLREQPGSPLPESSIQDINILASELSPGRYGSGGSYHFVLAIGQHHARSVTSVAHQADGWEDTSTVYPKRIFIHFFTCNLK